MKDYIWTPTARRTADALLTALKEAAGRLVVIFLTGFSGVGKTTLLEELANDIQSVGAKVVPRYKLRELKPCDHPIIVDENLFGEMNALDDLARKGWPQKRIVMPGLTAQEIRQVAAGCLASAPSAISDELVWLSAGSIRLLSLLLSRAFTQEQTVTVATEYISKELYDALPEDKQRFWENYEGNKLAAFAAPYLQIELPDVVLNALPKRRPTHYCPQRIYQTLPFVLERIARAGNQQPSPFFCAAQSEELLNLGYNSKWPGYEALAVNVSAELVQEFVCLFREETNSGCGASAGRLDCFGTNLSKCAIMVRSSDAVVYDMQYELPSLEMKEQLARQSARALNMPVDGATIFVHKHGHSSVTVPSFAWAFESWAQQRGVEYVVRNHLIGRSYRYVPATQQIEFVDFKVE